MKWDTLSQFDDEDQNAIPLLHTQLAETGYATLEVLGIIPYDKVSAIVEVSLPLAAYFYIPQNTAKTDFFKQNHQRL